MTHLFLESSTNDDGDWLILLFILGGLTQIIVGVIQIIGALIRTILVINAYQTIKKLCWYWIMVFAYFALLAIMYHLGFDWFYFIPVAWIIAIWYALVIVFNKKENEK